MRSESRGGQQSASHGKLGYQCKTKSGLCHLHQRQQTGGFESFDAASGVLAPAGLEGVLAQAVAFFEQQQVLGRAGIQRNIASRRHHAAGRRDQQEFVLADFAYQQVAGVIGQCKQREVEPSVFQTLEQALGAILAQRQAQVGILLALALQKLREHEWRDGGNGAKAQEPVHRAARTGGCLREIRGPCE